jgi:hypothetical protein
MVKKKCGVGGKAGESLTGKKSRVQSSLTVLVGRL